MARQLRVQFPGAIYHVTIRGNARRDIFDDDWDRKRFLARLSESVESYNVRLYLFCLMTNHTHLVLETPDANLSRFMQSLETGYTVYYNLRHRTVGHLMQGRYGAKLVEGDEYLLKLSRYVHLNPVFVGALKNLPLKKRIAALREYPWSSYPSYIGKKEKLEFVNYGPMLGLVKAGKGQRSREYGRFVESGFTQMDEDFWDVMKISGRSIGSDSFVRWVDQLYMELVEKSEKPEDISFRKQIQRLSGDEILGIVSEELGVEPHEIMRRQHGSFLRPVAARMLCKYGGLTNRATAAVLGLGTGAAVAWQIRMLGEMLSGESANRRLEKLVERIETRLGERMDKARCSARLLGEPKGLSRVGRTGSQ